MVNSKIFNIKLKRILVKFLILFFIIFFIFKLIDVQKKNIKKEKELKEYNKKIEEQTKKNEYLKTQMNSKLTDEYKEKYAREKLDMTKMGERVIYDITKE